MWRINNQVALFHYHPNLSVCLPLSLQLYLRVYRASTVNGEEARSYWSIWSFNTVQNFGKGLVVVKGGW